VSHIDSVSIPSRSFFADHGKTGYLRSSGNAQQNRPATRKIFLKRPDWKFSPARGQSGIEVSDLVSSHWPARLDDIKP